jgi:hypothetical protein
MTQLPDQPKPQGRIKKVLSKIVHPYGKQERGQRLSREQKLRLAALHNLLARGYDPQNAGRIVAGMTPEELRRYAYPADYP